MIVIGTVVKRLDLTVASFGDITAVQCLSLNSVDTGLAAEFASDLTTDEQWRVKIRIGSADATEEATLIQAYQALGTIRTFNNKATPTNAEILAEVKLLGTVSIRLIQRVLGDYTV
jgi:hypothetical protein